MCLVAAAASALRGGKYTYEGDDDVGKADVVMAAEEMVSA
jgi:ribosomal protein L13